MPSTQAKDVFDRARFHLNDVDISYFTNAILMPALQVALDDLKGELYDNNIPITNAVSGSLTIKTNMFDIGGPTGPPLPDNLIEIQELFERTLGSSEDFIQITKQEFLPLSTILYQQLMNWTWQDQQVRFMGALSNREVKMNYIKDAIGLVSADNSEILMIRALPFLAYRTAALAAGFQGEDDAREEKLNNNAGRELDKLMNISTKGRQVIPIRRRPFMAAYRRNSFSILR